MSRDYRKLEVFVEANRLVPEVYALTAMMPVDERYGLVVQIRKAAVSVPTNLVEGSSRRSTSDYCRFIEIAYGSAREVEYLLGLSVDLKFLERERAQALMQRYNRLQARLARLSASLEAAEAEASAKEDRASKAKRTNRRPSPAAESPEPNKAPSPAPRAPSQQGH